MKHDGYGTNVSAMSKLKMKTEQPMGKPGMQTDKPVAKPMKKAETGGYKAATKASKGKKGMPRTYGSISDLRTRYTELMRDGVDESGTY